MTYSRPHHIPSLQTIPRYKAQDSSNLGIGRLSELAMPPLRGIAGSVERIADAKSEAAETVSLSEPSEKTRSVG